MAEVADLALQRIEDEVVKKWFLSEPALHTIWCTHECVPNGAMSVPFRCGRGRIEFCPSLVIKESPIRLEELMRVEVIRILLKHPYERQPDASPSVRLSASDIVISQSDDFRSVELDCASNHMLPCGQFFEWYAARIKRQQLDSEPANADIPTPGEDKDPGQGGKVKPRSSERVVRPGGDGQGGNGVEGGGSDDGSSDSNDNGQGSSPKERQAACQTEMWEEDQLRQCDINERIEAIKSWGSLPASLVESITASTKAKVDYRKVLSGFRASILSSRRSLTRMKPNRRTDFQNMGSLYRLRSRLLVAVDASGSVSNSQLSFFLGVVNKFFKYGIESIEVITFDSKVYGQPVPLKKADTKFAFRGRGGTDYQPVFDLFASAKAYDGLIVFTDGDAPAPVIKGRKPKVVWILTSKEDYDSYSQSLSPIGRCCFMDMV